MLLIRHQTLHRVIVLIAIMHLLGCVSPFTASPVPAVSEQWQTAPVFSSPESVVFDPQRELLYVSNMRNSAVPDSYTPDDVVSKVSLNGDVIQLAWVTGLIEPTGITLFNDKLYIVERTGIAIASLDSGEIIQRIPIHTTRFLNDITINQNGDIYVSASDDNRIILIRKGSVSEWLEHETLAHTNGLFVSGNILYAATIKHSALQAINIDTHNITTLALFPNGMLDGVQVVGDNYWVSLYEGELISVSPKGEKQTLLNLRGSGNTIADFIFIETKRLLIVPSLSHNKLISFHIEN